MNGRELNVEGKLTEMAMLSRTDEFSELRKELVELNSVSMFVVLSSATIVFNFVPFNF
jgi:hypothetical protein